MSKGGARILEYYGKSHIRAITELYPECALDARLFLNAPGMNGRGFNQLIPISNQIC